MTINILVKKLHSGFDDIPLPAYSTEGSAGMDLRAAIKDDVIIEAGKTALIPTNLSIEIPEGYEIQVRPRSGLAAKHSIGVLNSPGTIDSDYRGEIKVIMFNFGGEGFRIQRGDRIAQMILSRYYKIKLIASDEITPSLRGSGGFGHTGKS